jgi:hypothetical protein
MANKPIDNAGLLRKIAKPIAMNVITESRPINENCQGLL